MTAGRDIGTSPRTAGRSRRARRGASLLAAMVCTMLAAAVVAGMLHAALRQRIELRHDAWRRQAAWLAQSGLERAARQLRLDPQYAGEQWRPAEGFAAVEIAIARGATQWTVTARADYPDDSVHRARESRRLQIAPIEGSTPSDAVSNSSTNANSTPNSDSSGDTL